MEIELPKTVNQRLQWVAILVILLSIGVMCIEQFTRSDLYVLPGSYVCKKVTAIGQKYYFECENYSGIDTLN